MSGRRGVGGCASRGSAWSQEQDEIAWQMYWNGRTYDQIAERLKRVHSTVYSRLRVLKDRGGPNVPAKPSTVKRRVCLCCRKPFASQWMGNRVCSNCKVTEAYA